MSFLNLACVVETVVKRFSVFSHIGRIWPVAVLVSYFREPITYTFTSDMINGGGAQCVLEYGL